MFLRSKNFIYLRTVHQLAERISYVSALEEHLVELLSYRHFDAELLCELVCRLAAEIALDSSYAAYSLLGRNALSDEYAGSSVAAVHTCAGDDEVAYAGKSAEGLDLCSASLAETCYLVDTAGHERCLCVVTEAHSVTDTAAERDNILQRSAYLAADNVVVEIETEEAVSKLALYILCSLSMSSDAQAIVVGTQRATSSAWEGPERTTSFFTPSSSYMT